MGFRQGAYATVWSVEAKTDTWTKARISISRKNKETGDYVQEFSGFVDFVGSASAAKAKYLKEKDRIKLGDTDVVQVFKPEKNVTYTNFKVYSFDLESKTGGGPTPVSTSSSEDSNPYVSGDEIPFDDFSDTSLPF